MATSSLLRIDMAHRSIYLAKSGGSRSQRTHFGIFISNAECDFITLSQDLKTRPCQGTIIHVIGEPLMMGYQLEIKRNYECNDSEDLKSLIFLGSTDVKNIHEPTSKASIQEDITRSTMEHQAATITPPPKGQSVRAPVDGVNTKRCQEWTMEFLTALVNRNLIDAGAVEIAQQERDPPTHGIFGYKQAEL